jgi:regulatory protein
MATPENSANVPLEVLDSRAYSYALNLLSAREYCSKDLKRRLSLRDYSDSVIDAVLQKLITNGYLNDARYAKLMIARELRRGKGRTYILNKLYFKKLSEFTSMLPDVLEEEAPAYENALSIFMNKQSEELSKYSDNREEYFKAKNKILSRLIRRGLNYQEALELLKKHST